MPAVKVKLWHMNNWEKHTILLMHWRWGPDTNGREYIRRYQRHIYNIIYYKTVHQFYQAVWWLLFKRPGQQVEVSVGAGRFPEGTSPMSINWKTHQFKVLEFRLSSTFSPDFGRTFGDIKRLWGSGTPTSRRIWSCRLWKSTAPCWQRKRFRWRASSPLCGTVVWSWWVSTCFNTRDLQSCIIPGRHCGLQGEAEPFSLRHWSQWSQWRQWRQWSCTVDLAFGRFSADMKPGWFKPRTIYIILNLFGRSSEAQNKKKLNWLDSWHATIVDFRPFFAGIASRHPQVLLQSSTWVQNMALFGPCATHVPSQK